MMIITTTIIIIIIVVIITTTLVSISIIRSVWLWYGMAIDEGLHCHLSDSQSNELHCAGLLELRCIEL
jgi:hypothetical protein